MGLKLQRHFRTKRFITNNDGSILNIEPFVFLQ